MKRYAPALRTWPEAISMREDIMDCTVSKKQPEIILDFCAGSLDSAQAVEFERHLHNCGECARLVAAQRTVWESLDRLSAPEISADFDTRLYARVAQEDASPVWRKWLNRVLYPPIPVAPWKPALSAIAAAAVITLGVVAYYPRPTAPIAAPIQQLDAAHDSTHVDIE